MTNEEYLNSMIAISLKDFNLSDDEKEQLVKIVLSDIAVKTNIFKKRCAYKIIKDTVPNDNIFDFKQLSLEVFNDELTKFGSLQFNNEEKRLEV